jgi:hypothetical protein
LVLPPLIAEILPSPIYRAPPPAPTFAGVIALVTHVLLNTKYCKKFLELPVVAKIDGEVVWFSSVTLPGLTLALTLTGTPNSKSAWVVWVQIKDCHVDIRCGPVICVEVKYAWVVPKVLREITTRLNAIIPMVEFFMV